MKEKEKSRSGPDLYNEIELSQKIEFRGDYLTLNGIKIPCDAYEERKRAAGPVRLIRLCIHDLKEHYRKILPLLPKDRQEKTASFRMENDRLRSLGAGFLIEYFRIRKNAGTEKDLLGDAGIESARPENAGMYKAEPEKARLEYGNYGKPYFVWEPEDNGNCFHFNVTHSGEYVIIALSPVPVGIDMECQGKGHEVLFRKLLPEERSYLERHEDRNRAFLELWTRKESLVKCSGEGISASDLFTVSSLFENRMQYCYRDEYYMTETFADGSYIISVTIKQEV